MRRSLLDRFLEQVKPVGDHLIWTGRSEGITVEGTRLSPRQLAWAVAHGGVREPDTQLGSACTDESCVKPSHLKKVDVERRLRRYRGRVLTPAQVAEIRERRQQGALLGNLARAFDITISHASRIVNGNRHRSK